MPTVPARTPSASSSADLSPLRLVRWERRPATRGPLRRLQQLVAKVRMRNRGEGLAALVDRLALELRGPVLGDDHVDLVARGCDHLAALEPGDDPRADLV